MRRWSQTVVFLSLAASVKPVAAGWDAVQRLSQTDSASVVSGVSDPLLALGNTILATWCDYYAGTSCIVQRRSGDGGANWGSVAPLTACKPWSAQFALCGSGKVLFAYDSASSVKFRRSTDNGATWNSAETLAQGSYGGQMAANPDGYVQFVWIVSNTIFSRRSTNSGADWGVKTPVRTLASSSELWSVVTAAAPYAYIVFQSGDTLAVARTTDNGSTWDAVQRLVVATSIYYVKADVDDQGRVHVMWSDSHTGNQEVYYSRSIDHGATWVSFARFTISNGSTPYWLDAKGANVCVSYQNLSTSKNRRRSFDGGATWEDESKWPGWYAPGIGYAEALLGEGGWLHFITMGYRIPDGYSVDYYRSKDAGSNWADSAVQVSDVDQLYRYPRAIVASGGNIHVLWEDYKYGNYEILHRRGVGLAGVDEQRTHLRQVEGAGPTVISCAVADEHVRTRLVLDAAGRRARQAKPGVYFVMPQCASDRPRRGAYKVVIAR